MKFYDTLGLHKSATKDEIKKSYKRLAIKHHPDKGGGDSELFKTISSAYGVLSDDDQRARYDQIGDEAWSMGGGSEQGSGHGQGMSHADMFADMFRGFSGMGMGMGSFGGQGHQPSHDDQRVRNNHLHSVSVSLHDAFHGQHKTMRVNVEKTCMKCVIKCGSCKGAGMVNEVHSNGMFHQVVTKKCEACKGNGSRVSTKPGLQCNDCKNSGKLVTDHVIHLNIPAGVHSRHRETFKGLGEQAQSPEETPGNLIVEICVTLDAVFKRDGDNLLRNIDIALWDSIMGKKFHICMFDADITLHTSELGHGIVRENEKYVLKGKGMPVCGDKDKVRGDLIITFNLTYPQSRLTPEEHARVCDALGKL